MTERKATEPKADGVTPAYKDREPKPNVHQRLLAVQAKVKGERSQRGKFGPSRSAESVLAEAKPVAVEHGILLTADPSTEIDPDGRRYLVIALSATNVDDPSQVIVCHGRAWEGEPELTRDGRPINDTPQVTGKADSYALKFALQHLLAIGGEGDPDVDNEGPSTPAKAKGPKPEPEPEPAADPDEVAALRERANKVGAGEKLLAFVRDRYGKGVTLTAGQLRTVRAWVEAQEKAAGSPGPQAAVQQPQASPEGNGPAQGEDQETASLRALAMAEWNELEANTQVECMADLRERGWPMSPASMGLDQLRVLINEVIPAHTPAG